MEIKTDKIRIKDMEMRDLIQHYEDFFSIRVQMEINFRNIVTSNQFQTEKALAVDDLTATVFNPFLEVLEQAVIKKGYANFNLEHLTFLNYFEDSINITVFCNMPAGHNWKPILQQLDLSNVKLKGKLNVFFTNLTKLDNETTRTKCFIPVLDSTFSKENYKKAEELSSSLQPDDLVLRSQKFKVEN